MKRVDIYFKDLGEAKQREMVEKGMVDGNIDLTPLAIVEQEEEEDYETTSYFSLRS